MDKSTRKVAIRPVSNWTMIAAQYKRAGCRNTTEFIIEMILNCIRVPAWEIVNIQRVFNEAED